MTSTRVKEILELKQTLRNHVVEYKQDVLHQLEEQRKGMEASFKLKVSEEDRRRIKNKRTAITSIDGMGTSLKRIRSSTGNTRTPTPNSLAFRVERTSFPPQRYQRQAKEEKEPVSLVLTSRESSPDSTVPPTSPSTSTDQLSNLFDQNVHRSIYLQRDIHKRRIAITRKRQLPRTSLPFRTTSHWDTVLDEMREMAMDFTQERNWKRVFAFHLAREVVNVQNQDKIQKEQEDRQRAKDVAGHVATFWRTMERMAIRSRSGLESNVGKGENDNKISMEDRVEPMEAIPSFLVNVEHEGEALVKVVEKVKNQVQEIVRIGKQAREGCLGPQREELIQQVVSNHSLATFQLTAIRWMMEICCSGYNLLLNDQFGMAKSSTVTAFLHVMDRFNSTSQPHLIIVPNDELHKWAFHLRQWTKKEDGKVQIYIGSPSHRLHLQREWSKRPSESFMTSAEVEELEKEENIPLYCCICPISLFMQDQQAFLSYSYWQMLIVEKNTEMEDLSIIQSLQQIPQQQQRLLCCDDSFQTWKNANEYTCFLTSKCPWNEVERQVWIENGLESDTIRRIVLYWLSLRRNRHQVESELGKVEESSVSCRLSTRQQLQYQNTVNSMASISSMETWLKSCLELRSICNGSEMIQEMVSDLQFLLNGCDKLQVLYDLLQRLVHKESKRVVIYCQLETMLPFLEMFLNRMNLTSVRLLDGTFGVQQRSLCHFALETTVQVAFTSTRLATSNRMRSMPVYGADAMIVLDSDWNSLCDAKLRASWVLVAAAYGRDVPIYRFYCEETIESVLLRTGGCLTDKVFATLSPMELVHSSNPIEKSTWWSVSSTTLGPLMQRIEIETKYVDDIGVLLDMELDTEEHVLLSNTDELLPVEWYAVYYLMENNTEPKRIEERAVEDICPQSFEEMERMEMNQHWQDKSDLFYHIEEDTVQSKGMILCHSQWLTPTQELVLYHMRRQGIDLYDPILPIHSTNHPISCDPGSIDEHQMKFRVLYRVPSITTVLIPSGDAKLKVKKREYPVTKRKLDSISKEDEGVDFGPDDDFWGDTNLDALDSASWDDTAVLGNILGTTLDFSPIQSLSSTTATNKKKNKSTTSTNPVVRSRKGSIGDGGKEGWSVHDDIILKKLYELYGPNWTLVAQVFNNLTLSRLVIRKRTARQCYDRYSKVIAGVVSGSASTVLGTPPTKESKSAMIKQQKLASAAAALWTSDVVAQRIGIPESEMLLVFNICDSLPGIPPPNSCEISLKKKKKTMEGNDEYKSIRTSFEAIIQSMKQKTPPPPIPIPQPTKEATRETSSPTKPSTTPPIVSTLPSPHKSHHDLVAMLPEVPLAPHEVIKRSKEAASVAVPVTNANFGVVREVSPLSAAGDVMMGATFGSAALAARKAQHASLAARSVAVSHASSHSGMKSLSTTVPSPPIVSPVGSTWGDTPPTPARPTSGGISGSVGSTVHTTTASVSLPNGDVVRGSNNTTSTSTTMPVSTSALLHVLDRMPEVKNKIQAILNRSDCSEAQKVAMIARLLSNTNAINASGATTSTSIPGTTDLGPTPTSGETLAPIPMPTSLTNETTTTTTGSSTTTTNTTMDVG